MTQRRPRTSTLAKQAAAPSPAQKPEAAVSKDSLTITDNRTGTSYELPIEDGTIRATDLRQIKVATDDFGLMTYDPAFMNTASCRSADHLHRRRQGHPPVPRLPDRAARGEEQLPRGRLPARARRAADQGAARRLGARDHATTPSCTRTCKRVHGGLPLRRPPDGDAAVERRPLLSTFYPEAKDIRDAESDHLQIVRLIAKMPTLGRLRLPPHHGQAVRLPEQRALLLGELPRDALHDGGRSTGRTRAS